MSLFGRGKMGGLRLSIIFVSGRDMHPAALVCLGARKI